MKYIQSTIMALLGFALLVSPSLVNASGAPDANSVLILSTTVVGGASSLEATQATALGFTVEVADATAWAAKTTAEFATYRALILGDPNCSTDRNSVAAAVANKSVWGAAVTGNVLAVAGDPAAHAILGGDVLTERAIAFATEQSGKTGAYISLSCYYLGTDPGTPVPVLDAIAPNGFTVVRGGCFNIAHLVAADPALAGLTDAGLSNWDCSVHEQFDKWAPDFVVVALANQPAGTFTASDGTVGSPYIVARGPQLIALGLSVTPTLGSDPVGTMHVLTAELRDVSTGALLSGRVLGLNVINGPNTGAAASCNPAGCITGSDGKVIFSYVGAGGPGTDALVAFADSNGSGTNDPGEAQATASTAWILCGDGIIQSNEQCDPAASGNACSGNSVCTSNCICGCVVDANCDDGNACNGAEHCNTAAGQCMPGTPLNCDDGNLCNGVESCDPGSGSCVAGTQAAQGTPCELDGNVCTIDQCNAAGACAFSSNAAAGAACDDAVFCNGTDTCDGAGQCISSGNPCPGTVCNQTCNEAARNCFDPLGTVCDDGDAGTLQDVCNTSGVCGGDSTVSKFVVLRVPTSINAGDAVLGWRVNVGGNICADGIMARQFSQIEGTAVAPRRAGTAMQFTFANKVTGTLVTGGGRVIGRRNVTAAGVDTSGGAPELAECAAAGIRASQRRAQFVKLKATTGLALGTLRVYRGQTVTLPVVDPSANPKPQVVITVNDLRLAPSSTLVLNGDVHTQEVIVHVGGVLKMGRRARIVLQGLLPEQVIFVVDGAITTKSFTSIQGTLFGDNLIKLGWYTSVDGAVVGTKGIRLFQWVNLKHRPFAGW